MHAPSVMAPSHGKSYLWQGGVGGRMSGNALVGECVGGWECVGGLVRRWVGGWVGACEKKYAGVSLLRPRRGNHTCSSHSVSTAHAMCIT